MNLKFPVVMGIINVNSQSFYPQSREMEPEKVCDRAIKMLSDSASIIDLGACTTKPGSEPISSDEEIALLKEPLTLLRERLQKLLPPESEPHKAFRELISIDTFYSKTVKAVYELIGEFTVNDITAGEGDADMLPIVGKLKLPYIAMHNKGIAALKGEELERQAQYPQGVVNGVLDFFKKFERVAQRHGIDDWIVDLGFGFAKTTAQNYELLKNMEKFKIFNRPILAGLSRKSMIFRVLNTTPENALNGTTALNFYSLTKGADILRVHDVKEAFECINLYKELALQN